MQSKYSIKDLERLSGIKAHTLRIWEQRYELLNPKRTNTNIRYYNNQDLKKILNVSLLNNHGYKISNIARLSEDNLLKEAYKLLSSFTRESDQVDNLMLSLLDWDENKFEETVNNTIRHFGIENTVEKVVFPFLRQLGNMWQAGIVNPAQEHFISNLIRQKLIVEIDKLGTNSNPESKRFIFFLPSNEFHEMGLLYTYYLCRKKGHRCLYLGQSLPFEDLLSVYNLVQPDVIVSIFTSSFSESEMQSYLKECSNSFAKTMVLLSGRLLVGEQAHNYRMPENFKVFKEFGDFKALI